MSIRTAIFYAGLLSMPILARVSASSEAVPTKEPTATVTPTATPHPGVKLTDDERARIGFAEQRLKEKQEAKIRADYEADAALLYFRAVNEAVVANHKEINPKENYTLDADGYAVKVPPTPTPSPTPKSKKA